MEQLFLSHRNFLQVRDLVESPRIIEKPVLLKKRNTPLIGITKLFIEEEFEKH